MDGMRVILVVDQNTLDRKSQICGVCLTCTEMWRSGVPMTGRKIIIRIHNQIHRTKSTKVEPGTQRVTQHAQVPEERVNQEKSMMELDLDFFGNQTNAKIHPDLYYQINYDLIVD